MSGKNGTSEAIELVYSNNTKKVDDLSEDTAHLKANLDNLSVQFKEHRDLTNTKFDKVLEKLDDTKDMIQRGFLEIEKTQATDGLRITNLEGTGKERSTWKLALIGIIASPVLAGLVEIVIHVLFHIKG